MQERDEVKEKVGGYLRVLRCDAGNGEETRENYRKSEVYDAFGNANICRIAEAERTLLDYQTIERILARAERLREENGGLPLGAEMVSGESDIHLRARMYEIRRMIFSIPDEDAKLFLYYRYVYGETLEECAEMLSVSRATVYRIRRRALLLFAELISTERCDA